jgi:hypothetical protein
MNRVLSTAAAALAGGMGNTPVAVAAPEMPLYRCHKKVRALKIADVIVADAILIFEDKRFAELPVDPKLFARRLPEIGDYYVVYEDGYASISPAKTFEEGYAAVQPLPAGWPDPFEILRKIPADEPVFIMRGRDSCAYSPVMIWAADADAAGVRRAKTDGARQIAARMNEFPNKRLPD